jgi:hypothetical protein
MWAPVGIDHVIVVQLLIIRKSIILLFAVNGTALDRAKIGRKKDTANAQRIIFWSEAQGSVLWMGPMDSLLQVLG